MRRTSSARSLLTAVLVGALCTACAGSDEPEDDPTAGSTATSSPTDAETSTTTGPVAGAGAGVDAADTDAWCGAVTPEQLSAATGYDVVAIEPRGEGLTTCRADLSGLEVDVWWGTEPSKKSFEAFEAGWEKPAGVYDPTTVTLDSGQPAVVALQEVPPTAFAATVVDGSNVQARVSALTDQDAEPEELAGIAQQVLAVYFD